MNETAKTIEETQFHTHTHEIHESETQNRKRARHFICWEWDEQIIRKIKYAYAHMTRTSNVELCVFSNKST